MPERRTLRSRASLIAQSSSSSPATTMSRPRRVVSGNNDRSITVARTPPQSPDNSKKSIRLTVKMPSSKLREATSGGRKNILVNSRDRFEPAEILSGPRGSRAKRAIVDESPSEEDEMEEDEEVLPSEEDDEEEEEEEEDAEDLEDAEGESDEADANGDIHLPDPVPPPPPMIRTTGPPTKPSLTVTPAPTGKVKSVEAKQIQLAPADDDDEELSELDSDAEGAEEEVESEDVVDEDQDMDEDEEDVDSDGGTPAVGSRGSTPDVSKMTKRQRSRLDQVMGSDFLQLPMEPQIKKHLTAEEHAMRRAEMARRRKNLSEKRNEEEKMDTINRLLKKQAPKRRGKISAVDFSSQNPNANLASPNDNESFEQESEKPNPVFVRWVSNAQGCRIGVPTEWLESGAMGRVFEGGITRGKGMGRMIEEVEG